MAGAEETKNYNYEELRRICRKEKIEVDLQKLEEGFYNEITSYFKEKRNFLKKTRESENKFSKDAYARAKAELTNAKKLVKELYEKREKKIIVYALTRVRTNSQYEDTSNLLPEEELLYNNLTNTLFTFRKNIMGEIILGSKIGDNPTGNEKSINEEYGKENIKNASEVEKNNSIIIKGEIPQFRWSDDKIYGPFEKDDIIRAPIELAMLLIKQNKAEILKGGN